MNWVELNDHKVKIYSTVWCPDCHRLKAVFKQNNANYEEIDIDANPDAAKYLQSKTGKTAIPFVEIDEKCMVKGWHDGSPGKWDEKIFFDEITEQL